MSTAIDPLDPRYRRAANVETLADFQRDQTGIYRIFQGRKSYVPPEAFDKTGRYLGDSDAMRTGAGASLLHNGRQWNEQLGKYENKINWGNVIGLTAGGVAGGFEGAALYGAATGGGAAAGAAGTTGSVTAGAGAAGAGGTAATTVGGGTVAGSSIGGTALRYGLQYGGDLATSLIQAHAAGKASDAQQAYLEEALAYQKEKDAYDRQIAAEAVTKEATRYGDYQGRIAPWIANGTSANDRMAGLLGLPPRAPSAAPSASPSAPPSRVTPSPVGPPSPLDPPSGATPAAGGLVTLRAPDGSTKQVSPSEVPHYLSLGASLA